MPTFAKCIYLRPKVLATSPMMTIPAMMRAMKSVYRQYGIDVFMHPYEVLSLPSLMDLDVGSCSRGNLTAEQLALFSNRHNVSATDIAVYFVRTAIHRIDGPLAGCAACPPGQPSVVISTIATQWTLGHEVGHVLGLNHVNDNTRLMTGNGTLNIPPPPPPPSLTTAELSTISASGFVV